MPIHIRHSDYPKFSELPMFRAKKPPFEIKDIEDDESDSHLFRTPLYSNELITFFPNNFHWSKIKLPKFSLWSSWTVYSYHSSKVRIMQFPTLPLTNRSQQFVVGKDWTKSWNCSQNCNKSQIQTTGKVFSNFKQPKSNYFRKHRSTKRNWTESNVARVFPTHKSSESNSLCSISKQTWYLERSNIFIIWKFTTTDMPNHRRFKKMVIFSLQ